MEIANMLVLSTAHVAEETAKKLDRTSETDELPICVYDKAGYGWFIPIINEPEFESKLKHLPEELAGVLKFAKQHHCQWIMFDCDADEVEELPIFEW